MQYKEIVNVYANLEKTSSTLEKTRILANFLRKVREDKIIQVIRLITGNVFAPWENKELNMGEKLVISAISRVTGRTKEEIIEFVKKKGDLGSAAAYLIALKKQMLLFKEDLSVDLVYTTLRKIAETEGEGSIDKKISLFSKLLANAEPEEAKYLVRTVLNELRIGIGEGILRDAISQAFNVDKNIVERAYALLNDFAEVAELAIKDKEKLKEVKIILGRPIRVMLYHKAENIKEAMEKTGIPSRIEYKYDGFRTQIHKDGNKIYIFTRRLEEVSKQFPEVVERVKKYVKAEKVVLDSETIAYDPKTGKWLPFQKISQRIKRKYDIEKMMKEIPVETHVFDVLFLEDENLIDLPLKERLEILNKIIEKNEKIKVADGILANNLEEAEEFYNKALNEGAEGIMIKNINSPYVPGQRTGHGYKIKPIMETLDLVIVGAEWGEGKRAHWLSSYLIACRDINTNKLLPIGKIGTGMTEADLKYLTEKLKPLIIEEKGKEVKLEPKVIVEVAYQEIQKSNKYESGFALRFPRLVRFREDKDLDEVDTLDRVEYLYKMQRG